MEQWKIVQDGRIRHGYCYYVSNMAKVVEVKSTVDGVMKRELPQTPLQKAGYVTVTMHYETGRKRIRVHCLVARAFHPNPDNKPQVDHIDKDVQNNISSNLRWADGVEQAANKTPRKKAKHMTEEEVLYVFTMRGIKTAAVLGGELNRNPDSISDAWRGADKKKRIWRLEYLETNPTNKHLFV